MCAARVTCAVLVGGGGSDEEGEKGRREGGWWLGIRGRGMTFGGFECVRGEDIYWTCAFGRGGKER